MSERLECGCLTDGEFVAKPCKHHGVSELAAPACSVARENAQKLRDVADYYDKLSLESAAHGFKTAPQHHKEVADFLRVIARHIDVPLNAELSNRASKTNDHEK